MSRCCRTTDTLSPRDGDGTRWDPSGPIKDPYITYSRCGSDWLKSATDSNSRWGSRTDSFVWHANTLQWATVGFSDSLHSSEVCIPNPEPGGSAGHGHPAHGWRFGYPLWGAGLTPEGVMRGNLKAYSALERVLVHSRDMNELESVEIARRDLTMS